MSNSYQYKNHISFCPNCGTPLSEKDYNCPGCGINLVGYNEKYNRAHNLEQSAEIMEELAQINDELNQQITEDNDKIYAKEQSAKKTKAKLKKLAIILIVAAVVLFILAIIIACVNDDIEQQAHSPMSYEEVATYLENTDAPIIELRGVDNWDVLTTDSKIGKYGTFVVNQGYDPNKDLTYIETVFCPQNSEFQYSISHQFDAQILYAPKINLSEYRVEYDKDRWYSERFRQSDLSEDEFLLDEHIYAGINFVEKVAICDLGDYTMHVYATKDDTNYSYSLIALIKLDEWMYEFEIYTRSQFYFDEMMSDYKNYINMEVEKLDV